MKIKEKKNANYNHLFIAISLTQLPSLFHYHLQSCFSQKQIKLVVLFHLYESVCSCALCNST